MAVAAVWYAFAVAAGAFRSTAVEYRKSRAQHTAIWLVASELPVSADTAVPGSMGAKVTTLPGYFTAAAAGEGEDDRRKRRRSRRTSLALPGPPPHYLRVHVAGDLR